MKKFPVLLRILIILLLLVTGVPFASRAQAQPAVGTTAQQSQPLSVTLADWGYEDVTLEGPYSIAAYSIGLPHAWTILPGSTLNLTYNYIVSSPAVLEGAKTTAGDENYVPAATLQVTLNGLIVYVGSSLSLGENTIQIHLPDEWPVKTGDNDRLEVIFRVHGRCDYNHVNTLVIGSKSNLVLPYALNSTAYDLGSYPVPFYERTFLPNTLSIVLPKDATPLQTSTAFSVAAGLGSLSGNRVSIKTITDEEAGTAGNAPVDHAFLIGTPYNNKIIDQLSKNASLPVVMKERRMKLTTSGPAIVNPGKPSSYTIKLENTEASASENLSLVSQIPASANDVKCQPDCQVKDNLITWTSGPLAAGASASFNVSFAIPEDSLENTALVSTELQSQQQAVNVSSLTSAVQAGEPGTAQSTPAGASFFVWKGKAVPETDGVLQIIPSPWKADKAVLLITGLSEEAVLKAGQALGASTNFPGKAGQVILVENVIAKQAAAVEHPDRVTFADLGYEDETAEGVGRKDIFYQFDLPLDWVLTQDASVELLFSHSPLLDPTRSSITLFLNDTPISSAALDETNVSNGVLKAQLPQGSARPGLANNLLVQIEADLPDPCVVPETTQAWVSISAQSSLNLDHTLVDIKGLADLDYWPQAFISNKNLENLMIVLPQQPTSVEQTALLQVASFLGAVTRNDTFTPNLVTGETKGMDLAPYNVITIGRPTRSPLLQSVNNSLPQPFIEKTDKILQKIDNVVFQLPEGMDLGYLELITSPWNPERVMIAITGTSDLGMTSAAQMLVNSAFNWQLKGNLALIRDAKLYVTDTRNLTKDGAAGFTKTAVPEATKAAVVATEMPTAIPTAVSAGTVESQTPKTYTEQYPFMLPVILGMSLLALIIIVGIGVWNTRRAR